MSASSRPYWSIAVSPTGETAWSFNTMGMYRGKQTQGGLFEIGIYKDEP